ncbi:Six-hairpin glycosidase-like protein [Calycina marina]|uniref:Six-hairpin glycosidase-like protein n=1 Tax=Calycina marina TaxID=1763456 RepID=A0A9P8CHJ1_9HELO|nr:Six-hairpin glycosidase-like protein [Calycina marina]
MAKFLSCVAAVLSVSFFQVEAQCPDYSQYSQQLNPPLSAGEYKLAYQRPPLACRTFNSSAVEDTITRFQSNIFPNALDTAVKWKGFAADNAAEELTFLITGDINAMWLRDSANQMQSYLPLIKADSSYNSLASLYRGPPTESGLCPSQNQAQSDNFMPPISTGIAFECKYELDSLAAFLEISTNYYEATGDIDFLNKFNWIQAVNAILNITEALLIGTYAANGSVNAVPYTWQRQTSSATGPLDNSGRENPVQGGTGLVRSAFRLSDDSTIYQLFIPANMMFSRYLDSASKIMQTISGNRSLANHMHNFPQSINTAIDTYGIIQNPVYGNIYAFEPANRMDDANIPSLLSAPFFGYLDTTDAVYQNIRNVGGPHAGLGQAWRMASIIRIFTSSDEAEIKAQLKEIGINSFDQTKWSRQWFSWANGLFGQCILDLKDRLPGCWRRAISRALVG